MGRTCETVKGKREEGEGPRVSEADLAARRGLKRVGRKEDGPGRRGEGYEKRQGISAGTCRVYNEENTREQERERRELRMQLNTILLQAPVEARFKCVSVLSGCRIT